MSSGTRSASGSGAAYAGALLFLVVAAAFPVGLMVFNPTLMFDRGWHQYAGVSIYAVALAMLGREWLRLRGDERAFRDGPKLLEAIERGESVEATDRRLLPSRLRQLDGHARGEARPTVAQLMELNREVSGLDQERTAGRFTLTKYILYLLPVIGFIGTVEGISRALMNISIVLPMVRELDGFLNNLTGVTLALQIAFDSTLLALFLSAALMFVQTVVYRLAEDHLARVDAWVVEHVLPKLGRTEAPEDRWETRLDQLREELVSALNNALGQGFGPSVERFAQAVDRLPGAVDGLTPAFELTDTLRKASSALGRIEDRLADGLDMDISDQLEPIRRGIERNTSAVESLADQWTAAFERSNRSSQEQMARTLARLKDALDLLNVSIEQGNALYRNIVRSMFDDRGSSGSSESARVA